MGNDLAERDPLDVCEEQGISLQDIQRDAKAQEVITLVVEQGMTLHGALEKMDIPSSTWYDWLREGKISHLLINTRDQVREALRLRLFQKADRMIEHMLDIGLGELEDANAATQLRALTTMLIDMMGMENPPEGIAQGLSAEEYLQYSEFEPATVVVQNIQQQIVGGAADEEEERPSRSIEDAVDGEYAVIGDDEKQEGE